MIGGVRIGRQETQKTWYQFERTLVCLLSVYALLPINSPGGIWVCVYYSEVSRWNTSSYLLMPSSVKCWLLQWDYRGRKGSCKEYYTEYYTFACLYHNLLCDNVWFKIHIWAWYKYIPWLWNSKESTMYN